MRDRRGGLDEYASVRRPHLRRFAYALCGDWHAADDLVQMALARAYVAWPRIHRAGAEDAYVRRILTRVAIDQSRRPWRRESSGLEGFDQSSARCSTQPSATISSVLSVSCGQVVTVTYATNWTRGIAYKLVPSNDDAVPDPDNPAFYLTSDGGSGTGALPRYPADDAVAWADIGIGGPWPRPRHHSRHRSRRHLVVVHGERCDRDVRRGDRPGSRTATIGARRRGCDSPADRGWSRARRVPARRVPRLVAAVEHGRQLVVSEHHRLRAVPRRRDGARHHPDAHRSRRGVYRGLCCTAARPVAPARGVARRAVRGHRRVAVRSPGACRSSTGSPCQRSVTNSRCFVGS
ncbi:MAG: polymerase, sigma-24 subunit, subfamily [Nocardioides sp.]|nr:polymerase, sigma-24 subunit, subfamily [Nocardioides sp.]